MSPDTRPSGVFYRITWGARHYWLIVIYTLVFHYPLLLPGIGMPHWGDFYCFHSPMRIAAAQALHEGRIPFMTQAIFGGYPLYQDPQFAFFYPVNFLFALLVPNPNGEVPLDGYIMANLLVLSIGALYFVRSLKFGRVASLGATLIICFNGFVQMHITHINILQVMATGFIASGLLARLAWSGGRRWRLAIGAALALAAGNLAGHPQTTLFLHYGMGLGMLVLVAMQWQRDGDKRGPVRTLAWSAAAVVVGVAIAAVQLLPTAHLLSICARLSMSREEAMGEAMRLKHLPSLLFPGFYMPLRWQLKWPFYYPVNMYWISANPLEGLSFFGVAACTLGLVGFLGNLRRWTAHVLFWSAMFLLGAAMGEQLPIYGWLYDYVPMIKVVRVPSRLLWMFYSAWALLAAMGIQNLLTSRAALGGRRTLWLVLGITWLSILAVLGCYRDSWSEAFIHLFVQNHQLFDGGVHEMLPTFLQAIKEQGIAAGISVFLTVIWLWWVARKGGSRAATVMVILAIALELFYYGFCKSYIINLKPVGNVDTRVYASFGGKPAGRALVPSFIHGGGAINSAMMNDVKIANGYSVTYPDWVKAFELRDVPPWRFGIDTILLDTWNVSDIVVRKRFVPAKLGGQRIDVDDWGWSEIGAPSPEKANTALINERRLMPQRMTIDLNDLKSSVTALYVLCMSGNSTQLPDNTEVGRVLAVPRASDGTTQTFSIRLGREVGASRYTDEVQKGRQPAHTQPAPAYLRRALWEDTDMTDMYFASFAMPTTATLGRLEFEATGPFPATLGVSQVLVAMADGTLAIKYATSIGQLKEVDSAAGEYHLLRRKNTPGYAWMVPTGVRGSYKKTGNIMARMYDGSFDPHRQVIVDKRKYPEESATKTDASSAEDFKGSATITWITPAHVKLQTVANEQGWVLISMTWDKGWSAWLDGKPVELARANGPHCAVPVPSGRHEIRLQYRPVYWWPGVAVSLLAVIGCLAGLAWGGANRRRMLGAVTTAGE